MSRFPVRLGVLVAISGAASLIYELLWVRALGLHFGTTTPAITTVVATFMAGLGLGNLWFGACADRSPRPLALYRSLELSIAITGLGASLVLLRAPAWLDELARWCAAAGSLSWLAMACALALCMLAPTIAMGGTLPVLTRALSRRALPGRALGLLYACNTLGAVAGALLPDFVLIPRVGMTGSACVAAAANLTVALAIRSESEPRAPARTLDAARGPLAALAISASSGFCALGLELLWGRTLQHWTAALVTSFAVMLAVYLSALAGGALFAQRLADRSRDPLRAAALMLGLTAVCLLGPIALSPRWRDLEQAWWPRPTGLRRLGLAHEAVEALLHASYLEAAACAALGATFPFVAAAWLRDGKPGLRTGALFSVNTFAGVLGALVLGFVGLPALGEQASYCALALMLAGVAALCTLLPSRASPGRALRSLTLACFGVVLALAIALPNQRLFQAHFRSAGEVLAVREGTTTTAIASERYVYGEPYYTELLTPGVSMSSTRGDARRYMAVMAHAALHSARNPKRALLICYGVGNTASALLSDRELTRLDIVDISPEVMALAPHFSAARGDDPLGDPRTHVFIDDGRHHLITHAADYDVITAEPPPPNHAGVVNLYAREFYRLAKHRLAAGGVITQWLPVFQLSDSDVRAMIAAFVAELPHTALLYGYQEQLILIGALQPLAIDAGALRRLSDDAALSRDLRANGVGDLADLLGSVIQTDAELRRQVAGIAPLSDELPTLQYPYAAVRDGTHYTASFARNPERAWSLLAAQPDPPLRQRIAAAANATELAWSALPVLDRAPPEARELALGRWLQPAIDTRPDNDGLWALLSIDAQRVKLAERALQHPDAQALLAQPRRSRASLPRYLVLQDALWLLARRAFYARDFARALALLRQLTPGPEQAPAHALFEAGCLRALGDGPASAAAFRAAAAHSGERAFRAACLALADRAARPFAPGTGPWSLAE